MPTKESTVPPEPRPLVDVTQAFGLGAPITYEPVVTGLMNPNWSVVTTRGRYAVKQLRDAAPDAVRRQHQVLPQLIARGFAVPQPCRTTAGDTLVRVGDAWYSATGWLAGQHRSGLTLSLDGCAALGDHLGRLHQALAAVLPPAAAAVPQQSPTLDDVTATLDRFAQLVAQRSPADAFDAHVIGEVVWRRHLLERVADRRPVDHPAVGPAGWTHGDLNRFNLLFADDTVVGVLDWDRLAIRPFGQEVVRTATILFSHPQGNGVDLRRVAAFTAAYRGVVPIGNDALRDAAHRRWWSLVSATWQLRMRYEDGNPSCDHLFVSDGNLLRWWNDHGDLLNAALTA